MEPGLNKAAMPSTTDAAVSTVHAVLDTYIESTAQTIPAATGTKAITEPHTSTRTAE